jgi:hypothetical protein
MYIYIVKVLIQKVDILRKLFRRVESRRDVIRRVSVATMMLVQEDPLHMYNPRTFKVVYVV